MTERLLHFIWQFQYFTKTELTTATGEALQIIFPGLYNRNQGPDFLNARITIAGATWAGTIELHGKTSDWKKHGHQIDINYKNVVLHVVWEDDEIPGAIPVLELKSRVPKVLLNRYEELMNASSFIPCEKSIHTIKELTWEKWKERLLAERLFRKAKIADAYLLPGNYHWEETFWWLLARNFGMKVNADAFEAIARSISRTILAKHKNQLHQLEALLFGQAGLLNRDFVDDYPQLLQREYKFLQQAYHLQPIHIQTLFLRMRPGNFPTIRLAQLAMLIHNAVHLFSKIKEAASLAVIREWLDVTASDYWNQHYRFDEITIFKKKKTGSSMIDNIIINTVVPVLFAYGDYHDDNRYKEKAMQWLEEITAENNVIINQFQAMGIDCETAYDSQALLELKNEYCAKKRCLDCAVGHSLLSKMRKVD